MRSEERYERNLPRPTFASSQSLASNERVSIWKVRMYFPGPDARYNGAFGELHPTPARLKSFEEFSAELEEALHKLDSLAGQQFQGQYEKKIAKRFFRDARYVDPTLKIVAANGKSHLEIGAVNSRDLAWHKRLSADDVRRSVDVLRDIPACARTLMSTLETLA